MSKVEKDIICIFFLFNVGYTHKKMRKTKVFLKTFFKKFLFRCSCVSKESFTPVNLCSRSSSRCIGVLRFPILSGRTFTVTV